MRYSIYGAGVIGKRLFHFLGKERVSCFIDGNEKVIGTSYEGVKIVSLQECKENYDGELIIFTPLMAIGEISRRLEENDVLTAIVAAESTEEVEVHLDRCEWSEEVSHIVEKEHVSIRIQDCVENIPSIEELFKYSHMLEKRYEVKDFSEIRQQFSGEEKCFIIATGPSLRMEDLETLKKHHVPCIGMNGIYAAFGQTSWRPDIYVTSDPFFIKGKQEELKKMDVMYKFCSDTTDILQDGWHRFHVKYPHGPVEFSGDINRGLYSAMNVTFLSLQLAVALGFKQIYLLGVDNTFGKTKDTYHHFIKGYHSGIAETMYNRDTAVRAWHESGYGAAVEFLKKSDVKIYNATRGGELESFERVDFDKLFETGNAIKLDFTRRGYRSRLVILGLKHNTRRCA